MYWEKAKEGAGEGRGADKHRFPSFNWKNYEVSRQR